MTKKYNTSEKSGEGLKLKILFDELNVNRTDLASKLNVSRSTIPTWYTKHELPISTLLKIQKALNYDISHVFPRLMEHKKSEDTLDKVYRVEKNDFVKISKEQYQEYLILIEKEKYNTGIIEQKDLLIKTLRENIELLKASK